MLLRRKLHMYFNYSIVLKTRKNRNNYPLMSLFKLKVKSKMNTLLIWMDKVEIILMDLKVDYSCEKDDIYV